MTLQELKVGDFITHYCFGIKVEARVVECVNGGVITEHEPVYYGLHAITKSAIHPASSLQKKWGGTDEHGLPCKSEFETSPAAWYNGEAITSQID